MTLRVFFAAYEHATGHSPPPKAWQAAMTASQKGMADETIRETLESMAAGAHGMARDAAADMFYKALRAAWRRAREADNQTNQAAP